MRGNVESTFGVVPLMHGTPKCALKARQRPPQDSRLFVVDVVFGVITSTCHTRPLACAAAAAALAPRLYNPRPDALLQRRHPEPDGRARHVRRQQGGSAGRDGIRRRGARQRRLRPSLPRPTLPSPAVLYVLAPASSPSPCLERPKHGSSPPLGVQSVFGARFKSPALLRFLSRGRSNELEYDSPELRWLPTVRFAVPEDTVSSMLSHRPGLHCLVICAFALAFLSSSLLFWRESELPAESEQGGAWLSLPRACDGKKTRYLCRPMQTERRKERYSLAPEHDSVLPPIISLLKQNESGAQVPAGAGRIQARRARAARAAEERAAAPHDEPGRELARAARLRAEDVARLSARPALPVGGERPPSSPHPLAPSSPLPACSCVRARWRGAGGRGHRSATRVRQAASGRPRLLGQARLAVRSRVCPRAARPRVSRARPPARPQATNQGLVGYILARARSPLERQARLREVARVALRFCFRGQDVPPTLQLRSPDEPPRLVCTRQERPEIFSVCGAGGRSFQMARGGRAIRTREGTPCPLFNHKGCCPSPWRPKRTRERERETQRDTERHRETDRGRARTRERGGKGPRAAHAHARLPASRPLATRRRPSSSASSPSRRPALRICAALGSCARGGWATRSTAAWRACWTASSSATS